MRVDRTGATLKARLLTSASASAADQDADATDIDPTGVSTTIPPTVSEKSELAIRADRPRVPGRDQPSPMGRAIVRDVADADLHGVRRGEDPESTPYEILSAMGSGSAAADSGGPGPDAPSGISSFVARVLDQLSLSAWLPAALLTAGVAVLLQFRSDQSANVLQAVRALTADPVRVLVLIIPLLVIATVITQAFSFEAIRTLEGYWRRRGLAGIARTLMIRRHVRRKRNLSRRRLEASKKAYYNAEPRILRSNVPFPIVSALKAQALRLQDPPFLTEEERAMLDEYDWQQWSDAWDVAAIDHLDTEEEAYPSDDYRILPTRLGNLIRATEDQLKNTGDDIQGFALRRYALAPKLVQIAHDQYRNRLEMYCTLVFVSAALSVLTLATLIGSGVGVLAIVITAASFAALSEASYLASIASAAGYCSALREMDNDLEEGA